MKLIVRASVFALVLAGAFASSFIPKTASAAPAAHSLVVANGLPVPTCTPDQSCGL
jgi:hypothetical protein